MTTTSPPLLSVPQVTTAGYADTTSLDAATASTCPSLNWLVRLRWLSVAGQIVGIVVLFPSLSTVSQGTLLGATALTAASNLALQRWSARTSGSDVTPWNVMGCTLTLDCLLLSAWLGLTGATTNPFTVLYLVHIVLAAVVLNARWTAWISSLSLLCFAALFLIPTHACCTADLEPGVESAYLTHMQGMWFAFAAAAGLISYFVRQLALAAERQREQIVSLQTQAQRAAHMASLTTLAAGTAHELRTPLGTIAVAAHELKRSATSLGAEVITDDATLIEAEVTRCQAILTGMGIRLRAGSETPLLLQGAEILTELAAEYVGIPRLSFVQASPGLTMLAVRADLMVALRGVINNALDATHAGGSVEVAAVSERGQILISIHDTGCGMAPPVLARATEPFFTTKPPGQGVGLGLFVAFAFAQSNGGSLAVRSAPNAGTTVTLSLPLSGAR